MSWDATSLDAKFPTLESVAAFLDAPPPEAPQFVEDRDGIDRVRARLARALEFDQDLSNDEFPVDVVMQFHDLQDLKAQKLLLTRLVEAESWLEQPDGKAESLVRLRRELMQSDDSLAQLGLELINRRWFEPTLASRLAELRKTLEVMKWPTQPFRSASIFEECLQLDREAVFTEIARPLADRIRFNFQLKSDTAREDKPEWLFAYVLKLLATHARTVKVLQAFVSKPVDRLVQALTPVIVETAHKTYTVSSHFVSEFLEFAATLESTYLCDSRELISAVIPPPLLSKYIELEELAQLQAVKQLESNPASLEVDFDADALCAKPTYLAVQVAALITQSDYLLRLDARQVLERVHLTIVRAFLDFLEAERETYERSHSSFARAVGTAQIDKEGKKITPQRDEAKVLARLYGSASFFVLQLERMQLNLVVSETQVPLPVAEFESIRSFAAQRLAKVLFRDIQKMLKHYFRVDWQQHASASAAVMRSAVESLLPSIEFLNRLCPTSQSDRARVALPLAELLAQMFWQMVIQANLFSPSAAAFLRDDIELVWSALRLPLISQHLANIEATQVLENGMEAEFGELTEDQVDGLLRRRLRV